MRDALREALRTGAGRPSNSGHANAARATDAVPVGAALLRSLTRYLLHGIWLELSNEVAPEELHHHDVVHIALEELSRNIVNGRREEIIGALRQHLADIRTRRKSST